MSLVSKYFRESRQTIIEGWNRFWFTPSDPATFGVIRLAAGGMIFYTHLVWTLGLMGFLGPQGRLPEEFSHRFQGDSVFAWSHLYWIDSPAILWTLHIAALVVCAAFALGLFSRVTSVLAFLITVSYAHRAAGAQFGLDQINAFLALYCAIGPCGAAYSLDRLIFRRRTRESFVSANIAIRLIQLHMCVVYLFAGLGKLFGETWWNGTAMWGAFANYEYQSLDMTWLATYPLLINALTHATIVWEISYPVLVWPKLTRPIVVLAAIPAHMGIALCMGMITFGLIMLVGNLAFVSPAIVRTLIDGPLNRLRASGLRLRPTGKSDPRAI